MRKVKIFGFILTCIIFGMFLRYTDVSAKKSDSGDSSEVLVEIKKEVHLNRTEAVMPINASFNLNLIGVNDRKVFWKSSNEKIATISDDGYVVCLKKGTVTLSGTYKGETYICNLTVRKPYISASEKICEIGDAFYVKLKGVPTKEYLIKDETVISVSSKGKVRAKRAGSTTLTIVGENGKNYKCKIKVYDTKRGIDTITVKSGSSIETSKIKAKDVPNESFSVKPGTLVNFTNIIYKSGTPEGLVYLKNSGVSKRLSYSSEARLQKELIKHLSEMIDAAYEAGKYKFYISSSGAYRSYSTQDGYWQRRLRNTPSYGDDPYHNGVKCVPGVSSEHRTGYAIDFDTSDSGFKWLEKNSYKYGFVKRYYAKKTVFTGVMDEYWHFTYVGEDVAATCYLEGICLEEYYEKYVDVSIESTDREG